MTLSKGEERIFSVKNVVKDFTGMPMLSVTQKALIFQVCTGVLSVNTLQAVDILCKSITQEYTTISCHCMRLWPKIGLNSDEIR